METLIIFLVILGLGFFLMQRGGMGMGCCGGGHAHRSPSGDDENRKGKPTGEFSRLEKR